eukprot:2404632-Rhodomonas_salina.2
MSGTDVRCCHPLATRCPRMLPPTCYEMSGTDLAYAATRHQALGVRTALRSRGLQGSGRRA